MTLEQIRREYAREVWRTADPPSEALEDAFGRVPRERFMNPGPWRIAVGALGDATHARTC